MPTLIGQRQQIAENIIGNATRMLKSRALGGVTPESVSKALEFSAKSSVKYGEKIKDFNAVPVGKMTLKEQIEYAVNCAKIMLQPRVFGGYTKESAQRAIERAAYNPLLDAEYAVDKFLKQSVK